MPSFAHLQLLPLLAPALLQDSQASLHGSTGHGIQGSCGSLLLLLLHSVKPLQHTRKPLLLLVRQLLDPGRQPNEVCLLLLWLLGMRQVAASSLHSCGHLPADVVSIRVTDAGGQHIGHLEQHEARRQHAQSPTICVRMRGGRCCCRCAWGRHPLPGGRGLLLLERWRICNTFLLPLLQEGLQLLNVLPLPLLLFLQLLLLLLDSLQRTRRASMH
jgi:hypothetical protein